MTEQSSENAPRHRGGVIHTYQQYDPKTFPSPTSPPPDLVSPAFEHMLTYGSMREFTEEELAETTKRLEELTPLAWKLRLSTV